MKWKEILMLFIVSAVLIYSIFLVANVQVQAMKDYCDNPEYYDNLTTDFWTIGRGGMTPNCAYYEANE